MSTPKTNRTVKGLTWILAAAVLGGAGVLCTGCEQQRRPSRYLIPGGYVGWVTIEYRVKGAPALPIEDGFYLVKVPPGGLHKTSSAIEYGLAKDEYYYYSGAKRQRLKDTGSGAGGMIWGGYIGGYGNQAMVERRSGNSTVFSSNPDNVAEGFFVGPEAQFKGSPYTGARKGPSMSKKTLSTHK